MKNHAVPNQEVVHRQILDSTGSYIVTYRPDRKIEIKLPGTGHIVIVGPIRSRTNTGIVIVNPEGAETNIPTYDPLKEAAGQSPDGLQDGQLSAWEQPDW